MNGYFRPPRCMAIIALAFCLLTIQSVAQAAYPGALDPTFGNGGYVTTTFGSTTVAGYAMAIQQDGMMIVAGNAGDEIVLVRYRIDGTIDSSFGSQGRVIGRYGAEGASSVRGVAVQPDGKLVVAGYTSVEDKYTFALARYNRDGSGDPTFGSAGTVTTSFGNEGDQAFGVAIDADGKIVVVGFTTIGGVRHFALARYWGNGRLDKTFGNNGTVVTVASPLRSGELHGVVIQRTDGKIAVAGAGDNDWYRYSGVVARYLPDGSLDAGFGTDGHVFSGEGEYDTLFLQSDGKLVAAGMTAFLGGASGFYAMMTRVGTDGAVDASFGYNGILQLNFSNSPSLNCFYDADEGAGETIMGAGMNEGKWSSTHDFALARFDRDGQRDVTFGEAGVVLTDFPIEGDDVAYALVTQADGRVVLAGYSNGSIALARYLVDTATPVVIEVKPSADGEPQSLLPGKNVQVAILSRPVGTEDAGFDATIIDPATVTLTNRGVTFGTGNVRSSLTDVNADGLPDLVLDFEVKVNALRPGKLGTVVVLEGKTSDGASIKGSASIDLSRRP
ncbi:MAG TPA: hypothetical protein VJ550_03615 [Geomonas sp.]|nr:hypothetical protein [Geomonas sp.]